MIPSVSREAELELTDAALTAADNHGCNEKYRRAARTMPSRSR